MKRIMVFLMKNLYHYLQKNKTIIGLFDFLSYIKRKTNIKIIDKSLITNIEWITEYNIPIERFYKGKPIGISWVARLKNADYFLKKCLESHIPFIDELILVDNKSTDKTKDICKELKNKYPNKVKFYEYPYIVNPPSDENDQIPTNSIHSLAYYYNWCFSKTKYSHVMKVDDDNFLIKEKWWEIRKQSLSSKKYYNIYWGINLIKDADWKIWTPKWYEFSWKYWDHGIYPVSPYTYYIQWKECEVFLNNLKYKRFSFSFFHLKFLKPGFGFHNLKNDNYAKCYKENIRKPILYNFKAILEWNDKNIDLTPYIKNVT